MLSKKESKGIRFNGEQKVYCVHCGCYYLLSNLYTNQVNWMCPKCQERMRTNDANRS